MYKATVNKVIVTSANVLFDPAITTETYLDVIGMVDFIVTCDPPFDGEPNQVMDVVCQAATTKSGRPFMWSGVIVDEKLDMMEGRKRLCRELTFRATY